MGVGSWFEGNTRRVVGDGQTTYFWADSWVTGVPLSTRFRCLFDLTVHRDCSVAEMEALGWEVGGGAWE
jgi:hypothetical protein